MPPTYTSLPTFFLASVDRYANPRAQVYRGEKGWEPIAANEMLRRVAGLSKALSSLGIRAGDRVALFAANCPEWHIADFAIQGLGGVTVPVYFNESADRLVYILNDAGSESRIYSKRASGPQARGMPLSNCVCRACDFGGVARSAAPARSISSL